MKTKILLVIILFICIVKSFGQLPPPEIQTDVATYLNDYKQSLLQQNNVAVAGWMVRVEKVGQWQQTWVNGVSEITNNTPLTGTEKFRIGNISQTFIAVAIMKMVQNNQIQLENSITSWLPTATTSLIPNAASITIKNLLQHTSGIAGYNEPLIVNDEPTAPPINEDWYNSNFLNNYTFDQIMNTYFTAYQPIATPSSNIFNYSETNYLLLGKIIENCTGLTWQQYITQNIITPLNLTNTSCILDGNTTNPSNFMSGYILAYDENENPSDIDATIQNNSIFKGSRGMISTLNDLNTFWKSVRQGIIIPPDLATILQTCNAFPNGDTTQFGFGLGCTDINQEFNWIGNDGFVEGYCSAMYYLPNIDAYVSVVNNKFIVGNFPLIAGIEFLINDYYLSNTDFKANLFSIYPNPTSNSITVNAKNTIEKIEIYDVLGRVMKFENKINALEKTIDVANLSNGNYIIKIEIDGKMSSKKFIKQ